MNEPNLIDRIAQFIERFVFFKDRQIYRLITLWVVQTHMYKDFEYVGYVFAHSPQPGSGKSRLLEVLRLLVANPTEVECKPSDAVLFREADGMTQLLDEVDTWTNRESLSGILNSGFQRGGAVRRMEQHQDGKWIPVSFNVYAPRAMAGIGLGILNGTTKDRAFIIPMTKQKRSERREKFRSRNVKPVAEKLKQEIGAWVNENRKHIVDYYNQAEKALPYLNHLRDRTMDITEPMAAILEAAYSGSSELESRRSELLEAISVTRKDGEEYLADHRILRELLRIAGSESPLIGNATELAAKCELDPRPSEYDVAGTLRRYGFENRSIRVGDSVRHRYELTQEQLADRLVRFEWEEGESETQFEAATVLNSPPL